MSVNSARKARRAAGVCVAVGAVVGAALGQVSAAGATEAEGTVIGAGGPHVVAGSYLVTLKGSAQPGRAEALTSRHGGAVTHRFSAALNGYSAKMSAAQARRLAADPAVASVSVDHVGGISGTQNNSTWNLSRIDQNYVVPANRTYTYSNTASNVTAYVLDTGIKLDHPDFGGRAVSGIDTIDNDNDASDCNGHGTHVAGIIGGTEYGVAKGVKLVAVRVADCQGNSTTSQVVAGLDWVVSHRQGPSVANISLQFTADPVMDAAVQRLIDSGVSVAIAAGNWHTDACTVSPARVPNAITVGSSGMYDVRSSFSNYGTCVDMFAPGESVLSDYNRPNVPEIELDGTSMASPHVAGAVAVLLSTNPSATPADVTQILNIVATSNTITDGRSGTGNRMLKVPGSPLAPSTSTGSPADVALTNLGTLTTQATYYGQTGNASATSLVGIHLMLTQGDSSQMRYELVGPSGRVYLLKDSGGNFHETTITQSFVVNLSSETRNGTWQVRITDVVTGVAGYQSTWYFNPASNGTV